MLESAGRSWERRRFACAIGRWTLNVERSLPAPPIWGATPHLPTAPAPNIDPNLSPRSPLLRTHMSHPRRTIFAPLCLALLAFVFLAPVSAENRVLFLAGARSHGPGEHEFNAGCRLLAKALNEQSGLDIQATVINGWPKDEAVFDGIKALIIYADSTSVVSKGWDKVDALAKKGVGIMFMHYAVHPNAPEGEKYYRPWIGGAFETGFSVNPHWVAELQALPNHPVSRGINGPIEALDEFYYSIRFRQNRGEVLNLATATPTRENIKKYINLWNEHGIAELGKPQPLMWGVERADGGRGVGFTGGHYHRNWAIDGFRKLALNAIVWVAGLEVPKDGVKSNPLTEDELNANLDDKGKTVRLTVPQPGEFKAIPAAEIQTDREKGFGKTDAAAPATTAPAAAAPAEKSTAKPAKISGFKVAGKTGTAQSYAKPIFESPVLKATTKDRLVKIDVPLKDAKELYLVVSSEGSISCDWSDWLEPQLVMANGTTTDLTALKWKSAKAGFGSVRVGKSAGNAALLVDRKTHEHGLGTHAASVIVYDLPAGVVGFRASVAIDDGGMVRKGEPSDAEVRFLVYTANPGAAAEITDSGESKKPADNGPTEVPVDMFTLPEGLEVTLWAKTPQLQNPTNIDFDAQGRLWVAEGVDYRGKASRQKEGDRIMVLEDTTGSGVCNKSTVFVQEPDLAAPLGVAVIGNKIVVSQPPDLLVYTDVNGDGKFDPAVDKREALLTGFNGRQHDHSLHSVTTGPDGQWYFNQGNTGALFTDKSGKTFRFGSPYVHGNGKQIVDPSTIAGQKSDDGHVWIGGTAMRMNPDGTNVTVIGHNFRNSFEQTVNSFGDVYQSDNDDPPACRVTPMMEGGNAGFASADGKRSWGADKRPGQDTPTAEWRQEDPGTMPAGDVYGGGSPTGVAFYENGALGDKWRGLLLACEAGKNVVFGYFPKPDGAGWKLERFDFFTSNKEKEWAGSDFLGGKATNELKTKFRPSDVCVGPDGAIYVADWFDARVGGHGTMDDRATGAIYRIAPKGFKSVVPKFDLNTTGGQIAALKSPAQNVRNSGFVRLKAQGANAVNAVAALLTDENPYLAARAAWLLAQMGDAGVAKVKPWLDSKDDEQRLVAYRALRRANVDVLAMAAKMASDKSAAVRREVALTLRDVPAEKSVELLVKLGQQFDGQDRAYLEAFGLGCSGKESAVYSQLAKTMGGPAAAWSEAFARIAWRLHPPEAVNDLRTRAISASLTSDQRKLALTALGFIPTREAANAMLDIAAARNPETNALAMWWLLNRKGNDWMHFGLDEALKKRELFDPAKVQLVAAEFPPMPQDAPKLPPASEIAKLKGDIEHGKTSAAICQSCHHFAGAGVDFGPDLTTFGRQQTTEVIAGAIANPSADISHGFEGSEIKTTDGLTITGMLLSEADPVIIKCMGGLVQSVPKSRIASLKPLSRSLMYDPAMLNLTPQSIADIVAYLKSL